MSAVEISPLGGGSFDDAQIAAAIASNLQITLLPGRWLTSAPIYTYNHGQRVLGCGKGTEIIRHGNGPVFQLGGGANYLEIRDLIIGRDGTPVAGDDGVSSVDEFSNLAVIDGVVATNQWHGFHLGPTGYSKLINCVAMGNYGDGIRVTNSALNPGGAQWSIFKSLSEHNNGYGLCWKSVSGDMNVGDVQGFSTMANGSGGIAALGGTGRGIPGVRIANSFIGEDGGNGGIYLDTYAGFDARISDCYIELPGTTQTGRDRLIPPTNLSPGIIISANNTDVLIEGNTIRGATASGIVLVGGRTHITGNKLSYCGDPGALGNQCGINILGGTHSIVGNRISNSRYSLNATLGGQHIVGNDLRPVTPGYVGYTGVASSAHTFVGNSL